MDARELTETMPKILQKLSVSELHRLSPSAILQIALAHNTLATLNQIVHQNHQITLLLCKALNITDGQTLPIEPIEPADQSSQERPENRDN